MRDARKIVRSPGCLRVLQRLRRCAATRSLLKSSTDLPDGSLSVYLRALVVAGMCKAVPFTDRGRRAHLYVANGNGVDAGNGSVR